MDPIKQYYQLTKPGIIYGNLLTATAGYLLASHWHIQVRVLVGLIVGTWLVIAAACVFNNYLDRGIDQKMERTQRRALASGEIGVTQALVYASVMLIVGVAALVAYTNTLTLIIGLIGFVDYVLLYGWSKRHSMHGTLVGSISGSAPIVAGYTAAAGRFDTGAVLLFLVMTAWQMPHFYAIALYRYKDYRAAGLPVLPVAKNQQHAQLQVLVYIVAFCIACGLLTAFGYTGYTYAVVMMGLGLVWLGRGWNGLSSQSTVVWGRRMFLFSLIVVLTLSVMTALGGILP